MNTNGPTGTCDMCEVAPAVYWHGEGDDKVCDQTECLERIRKIANDRYLAHCLKSGDRDA